MAIRNKNKKSKEKKPTIEEFLTYKPVRNPNWEWSKNSEGLVEIKVPKFTSNFGKSFCKVLRKDNEFTAKMDKIGTIVWEKSDGQTTVAEILEILKKQYPDEKDIDQRLFLFIQQIGQLQYINY